jgi:hypothetical protein
MGAAGAQPSLYSTRASICPTSTARYARVDVGLAGRRVKQRHVSSLAIAK